MDKSPEQRIDDALDSILKASGSSLKNYTMPLTLEKMRWAMRKIMAEAFDEGLEAAQENFNKD